jgi:hypothetical protein
VIFNQAVVLPSQLEEVVFRSRMLAFRGACGEPPRRLASLGVSPVPLIPQESRTLRSNQLFNEAYFKTTNLLEKKPLINNL